MVRKGVSRKKKPEVSTSAFPFLRSVVSEILGFCQFFLSPTDINIEDLSLLLLSIQYCDQDTAGGGCDLCVCGLVFGFRYVYRVLRVFLLRYCMLEILPIPDPVVSKR